MNSTLINFTIGKKEIPVQITESNDELGSVDVYAAGYAIDAVYLDFISGGYRAYSRGKPIRNGIKPSSTINSAINMALQS